MVQDNYFPANKIYFNNLFNFYKNIFKLCNDSNIEIILYGSFAVFLYTKNNSIEVNDIDLLVKQKDFPILINILENNKIKYNYDKKWQTIQVFNNDVKIEFDSIDFWQKNLDLNTTEIEYNSFKLKVLNIDSLKQVYKIASQKSSNDKEKNKLKLELLNY